MSVVPPLTNTVKWLVFGVTVWAENLTATTVLCDAHYLCNS